MISEIPSSNFLSATIPERILSTKERIYRKENRIELKNTHVYAKSMDFMSGKIIVMCNPMLESIRREHYCEHSGDEDIASLLGYSLVYHNTSLDDRDVVGKYYAKDTVERAFRQMKGIISLRPVRVWLLSHVHGHIKVCYLAYAILTMLQQRIERRECPEAMHLNC